MKRVLNGLHEACVANSLNSGKIITFEQQDELTFEGIKVDVVPAFKYFLEQE